MVVGVLADTTNFSRKILIDSLSEAISGAKILAENKKNKVKGLATFKPIRGVFKAKVKGKLEDIDIETKVKISKEAETEARKYSKSIKSSSCTYSEILDHKIIVTTDGTEVEIYDSKPEFNIVSVASRGSESVTTSEGIGVTGGWKDLFLKRDHLRYANLASAKAVNLLEAKHVTGEKCTVILDPGMVGLISHEAIGHMVEADFVYLVL